MPQPSVSAHAAHADHRIWQDVYRTRTDHGYDVYLKLTVIDDVLIVSFKEP